MREISGLSRGVSTLGGGGCQILGQTSGSFLRKERLGKYAISSYVVLPYFIDIVHLLLLVLICYYRRPNPLTIKL